MSTFQRFQQGALIIGAIAVLWWLSSNVQEGNWVRVGINIVMLVLIIPCWPRNKSHTAAAVSDPTINRIA